MKKELLAILNEYYGDSRSDDHKEEIADFVESMSEDILGVLWEELRDGPLSM
jgi:hypothetical protein